MSDYSIEKLAQNKSMKHLYKAVVVTAIFFILGIASSFHGFSYFNSDLSFITDNVFFANILFLGFVVSVNERIIEVVCATFRRRFKLALENKIQVVTNFTEKAAWSQVLNDYKAETRRFALFISLCIGFSLSCLGVVRVFGALNTDDMMVNVWHIALIDAVDIVITAWVIAGGTEGWSKLTGSLGVMMGRAKQISDAEKGLSVAPPKSDSAS